MEDSCIHRDRHLAVAIVNTLIDAFQDFLRMEKTRKITEQLRYLQQRKQHTLLQLDDSMQEHKRYLIQSLRAGDSLTPAQGTNFLAQTQQASHSLLFFFCPVIAIF